MTLPQQRMKSQPLRRFLFQRWFTKNSRRSLGPEVGFWVNLVILSEIMDQFLSPPPTSRYLFTWVKMHAGEESVRRTCRVNAPWGEVTRWGRRCGAWPGRSAASYLEAPTAEAESHLIMKEWLVFGQAYAWNLCPKVHGELRTLVFPSVLWWYTCDCFSHVALHNELPPKRWLKAMTAFLSLTFLGNLGRIWQE